MQQFKLKHEQIWLQVGKKAFILKTHLGITKEVIVCGSAETESSIYRHVPQIINSVTLMKGWGQVSLYLHSDNHAIQLQHTVTLAYGHTPVAISSPCGEST